MKRKLIKTVTVKLPSGEIVEVQSHVARAIESQAQTRFQRRLFRNLRKSDEWEERNDFPMVSLASVCAFDK